MIVSEVRADAILDEMTMEKNSDDRREILERDYALPLRCEHAFVITTNHDDDISETMG